ncbi:TetR/AcrR family transcriptional regulator [Lactococcus taiwanensis]|uniref:TetR/AcrR family transcriptional regulator n=1 Tax=Lactococcus taiwanensis TaxID=1151742 RepID=UPI0028B24A01|nr:TetR/AcrR family transcriptional regulator [Lactococcus taiwanensis]
MNNKRTADQIISYFLAELQNKPLDKISINEVSRKVGISRVTFYRYFRNKQDVLDTLLEQFLVEFDDLLKHKFTNIEAFKMTTTRAFKQVLFDYTLDLVTFFYSNKSRIKILTESSDEVAFMDILHSTYYNYFVRSLTDTFSLNQNDQSLINYSLYITGGVKSIIEEWYRTDYIQSPEEITNQILNMLTPSLQELLNKIKK